MELISQESYTNKVDRRQLLEQVKGRSLNGPRLNKEDYFHLQEELLKAGYDRDLYNPDFTLNPKANPTQSLKAADDFINRYPHYILHA